MGNVLRRISVSVCDMGYNLAHWMLKNLLNKGSGCSILKELREPFAANCPSHPEGQQAPTLHPMQGWGVFAFTPPLRAVLGGLFNTCDAGALCELSTKLLAFG
jgi:hypothetical protein